MTHFLSKWSRVRRIPIPSSPPVALTWMGGRRGGQFHQHPTSLESCWLPAWIPEILTCVIEPKLSTLGSRLALPLFSHTETSSYYSSLLWLMIFFSILVKDGSSESNKNFGQEMLLAGEMMGLQVQVEYIQCSNCSSFWMRPHPGGLPQCNSQKTP